MSRRKLRTAHSEAPPPPEGRRRAPNRETCQETRFDGCSTDPEPDMKMRQAHFRNMRSKCQCSCVLQFTRHHGVSSVLHRPRSQMIHCIVLCLDILGLTSREGVPLWGEGHTEKRDSAAHPNMGGEITNPGRGERSLNHSGRSLNPRLEPQEGVKRGMVPQQARAIPTYDG